MNNLNCKKVVVFISGRGSNLQTIIDKLHLQKIQDQHIEIIAVISNKDGALGLMYAKDANIPTLLIESKGISSREKYDALLMTELDRLQPDLILLAGFMRILSADFVNKYTGKILNIHPSLLPKYQGINTHKRAIDAGDHVHGTTVHFVTPELDGGPIILQASVPIFAEDTAEGLAERVLTQEHHIYPLAASWFLAERLTMQGDKAILDGNELGKCGYATDSIPTE